MMEFGDLHRQTTVSSSSADVACADYACELSHAGPDSKLVTDCQALVCQLDILLDGIEQAADGEANEHERLAMALCDTDNRVIALIDRISIANAVSICGVQSKHAVADRLLSTSWYHDPSPYRDALLLSFLRDAQRLLYPAGEVAAKPEGGNPAETRADIASGEACLRLIEELMAGFKQLEQDDMLASADQDQLIAALSDTLHCRQAAIASLAKKAANSVAALQVKALVLQRLLEVDDSDAHPLRVDLSRSYITDLNAFVLANERRSEAAPASNSLWNTLSSKVRCWISSGHQR